MNRDDTRATILSDKSHSDHAFQNRRTVLKLLIGACLAAALLLYAAQMMRGSANNLETAKETNNMLAAKTKSEPNHAIPPVDANVPARIETATFALG